MRQLFNTPYVIWKLIACCTILAVALFITCRFRLGMCATERDEMKELLLELVITNPIDSSIDNPLAAKKAKGLA